MLRSYIRTWSLAGFEAFILSKGGDPARLLERAGIDPRALHTPDMLIPFAQKGLLLDLAAEELGSPSLGLEWALSTQRVSDTGSVRLLAQACSRFGEWAERSMPYWRLQTNAVTPQLLRHPEMDAVGIRLAPNRVQTPSRHHAEHVLSKLLHLINATLEEPVVPLGVCFRHAAPPDMALHEIAFPCPIAFDAPHDEILFRADILDKPLNERSRNVQEIAAEFLRVRISLLPRYRPGVATSATLAIKSVLDAGICSKPFIARALGCSPRKLQRLLALEGTTYEDVLDAARRELACEFLVQSTAPVTLIGQMLDFASPAAMTLAVKRWTGMTPSEYRKHGRPDPAPEPGDPAPLPPPPR